MRILHITPDYYPALGGGELYVKEVSERLAARGHEVTVLAMNSRGLRLRSGAPPLASETVNRVQVRRLNNTYELHRRVLSVRGAYRMTRLALGDARSRMFFVSPWSLRAFLMTLTTNADVVSVFNWYHTALAHQTAVARHYRRFAFVGVPLCHTEQRWPHSSLFAQALARCDAVVAMTQHEKMFVEARSGRPNATVVGAGVEPALFAGANGHDLRQRYGLDGVPLVGYVGRMSSTKGVVTLIEAMRLLWRQGTDARLLLAGSGLPPSVRCEADIEAAFGRLNERERSRIVTISPLTDDDKPSIFDALDIFVMPSVAESFGIAYLEAWMCRKPVIGSRVDSTQCVIADGIDGLLADPRDPREVANAIAVLLADPQGRDRLGECGRAKTLGLFTWEKVTDRIERTYVDADAGAEAPARGRRLSV